MRQLNELFDEEHLAWHVVGSEVQLRAGEASDFIAAGALEKLAAQGPATTASELRKAVQALSRRPEPDTRDAVRSAVGAMEALARDMTGDRNSTLGDILKRRGNELLAAPLPSAVEKIWGYANDAARHVDETKAPTLDEAILVVGIAAAFAASLANRR